MLIWNFSNYGDPADMRPVRTSDPKSLTRPRKNSLLIKHSFAGVNWHDIWIMQGLYAHKLPFAPGTELIGVVAENSPYIGEFKSGDRVGCVTMKVGSLAPYSYVPHDQLIRIPAAISDKVAAATLFKGMLTHCLLNRVMMVHPSSLVLVLGAERAYITTQMADQYGTTVIGMVSNDSQIADASRNGCHMATTINDPNVLEKVRTHTSGHEMHVAYDFLCTEDSMRLALKLLGKYGMYVACSYSKKPPLLNQEILRKKSLFMACPNVYNYYERRLDMEVTALSIFNMLEKGFVKAQISKEYKFKEARNAYADLQNGTLKYSGIVGCPT